MERAWAMSAGGHLRYPAVEGGGGVVALRVLNAHLLRLLVAAQDDPVVADAFFRARNLLSRPESLLRPAVLARVLTNGGRPPARARQGSAARLDRV